MTYGCWDYMSTGLENIPRTSAVVFTTLPKMPVYLFDLQEWIGETKRCIFHPRSIPPPLRRTNCWSCCKPLRQSLRRPKVARYPATRVHWRGGQRQKKTNEAHSKKMYFLSPGTAVPVGHRCNLLHCNM